MTKEERDKLIVSKINLPEIIVTSLLKNYRYSKYRQYREDLVGEAMVSLVEAAENYDDSLGIMFSTYASARINGDLKRYIRKHLNRLGQEVHIDSIPFAKELQTGGDNDLEDDRDYAFEEKLIEALEPESEIEKEVYYDVVLGSMTIRNKAEELGISKSEVGRIKKKVRSILKVNYNKFIEGDYHG